MFKTKATLSSSLAFNRFPFFCAALVGGYSFLQLFLKHLLQYPTSSHRDRTKSSGRELAFVAHFVAAFVASWFSLKLLNIETEPAPQNGAPTANGNDPKLTCADTNIARRRTTTCYSQDHGVSGLSMSMAGKTMDLTLLVVIRALDAIIGDVWSTHLMSILDQRRSKRAVLASLISRLADTGVFAVSAGAVMWAWFYLPDRLPRAYNTWIAQAADVDHRLIDVLRRARWGEFVYGKDTRQAPILESMCQDYGWPLAWGDPAKTIPIPCEMVHCGSGPSCHWHAVSRFGRAFKFALTMYLPLQLLVRARNPSLRALKRALQDAIRSSAFLGAFISIFYYSVCLSRTVLGPKIFSPKAVTPMMWDSGLCVGAGCMMCGWSILIEAEKRRQEVAFFVAPRAAATLLPRRYERKVSNPEPTTFHHYLLIACSTYGENNLHLLRVPVYSLHISKLGQQEYGEY